jgi:hypothetical protein
MKKFMVFLMIACFLTIGSGIASASLLFDRGLPTTNLNSDAGDYRSNVSWANGQPSSTPAEYWLPGDDVVLPGSGLYHIDTIRVWAVNSGTSDFTLLAGSNTSYGDIFTNYTATQAKYTDTDLYYQGSLGLDRVIYQLDFTINKDVMAGKYYFFLNGPRSIYSGGSATPYLHASNAALSGSTQNGADNLFQWLHINDNIIIGVDSWNSSGDGWDKSSDANVQVYGTKVPEPATMLLLGLGLVALAGARRKSRS